jgi:hypothetical protein
MIVTVIQKDAVGQENKRTVLATEADAFVAAFKKATLSGTRQIFEYKPYNPSLSTISTAELITIQPTDMVWIESN